MPRDGSNIYHRPAGTDGIPNYPIESSKYNSNVADVEQDLNLPRPIVAGGTGATNAADAMMSLRGDVAYQVVTNYDSYLFVSGTFSSAAGATGAPTVNAFVGICYASDPPVTPPAVPASANLFVEARDQISGIQYIRSKVAGVWGAWAELPGRLSDLDARFVNISGDTMTGSLSVSKASPTLLLVKPASGSSCSLLGYTGANPRWEVSVGGSAPESSVATGSDFAIARYNNAGALIDIPLLISRDTGYASFLNDLTWGGIAWTPYFPAITFTGGAGNATGRFKKFGKLCAVSIIANCTSNGTMNTADLPFQINAGFNGALAGREVALTGVTWVGYMSGGNTFVNLFNYNNSGVVTTGASVRVSGIYETV